MCHYGDSLGWSYVVTFALRGHYRPGCVTLSEKDQKIRKCDDVTGSRFPVAPSAFSLSVLFPQSVSEQDAGVSFTRLCCKTRHNPTHTDKHTLSICSQSIY